MPVVTVALPPASLVRNRQHVTIAGTAGTVTFNIARPEVEFRAMADEWSEEQRANGVPVLEHRGRRLRTFTLSGLFTHERWQNPSGEPAHINDKLVVLAALAAPDRPDRTVVVSYDPLTAYSRFGGWVISDLSFRTIRRRPSDNYVVRAEVDVTIVEASRPPTLAQAGTAKSAVKSIVSPPAVLPTDSPTVPARRHTFTSGETLWQVAEDAYGNGALWPIIAAANGITDVRQAAAGTVLTIPPVS